MHAGLFSPNGGEGNFATPYGAVSCTGVGEEILDAAAASTALTRVEDGFSLSEAIAKTFNRHKEKRFGMIALDANGNAIVGANGKYEKTNTNAKVMPGK